MSQYQHFWPAASEVDAVAALLRRNPAISVGGG